MAEGRIPKVGTRWVWEIELDHAREIIEVTEVKWNGEEWWVKGRTMPTAPNPMLAEKTEPTEAGNELDRFWEAATPIGGTVEDLTDVEGEHG